MRVGLRHGGVRHERKTFYTGPRDGAMECIDTELAIKRQKDRKQPIRMARATDLVATDLSISQNGLYLL